MPCQPPITPSPHRFLAGKQKSPSPTKDAKSGPSFRKEATQPTTSTAKGSSRSHGPKQFATTPRFSFGRPKPKPREIRSPSPPKPVAVQSFRTHARTADEVEDAADENEPNPMFDVEYHSALPTIEHDVDQQQWTNDLAFSPKRRRLEDGTTTASPTRPTFRYPGAPASELNRATPQFTPITQDSTQVSTASDISTLHRPAFIRLSAEPQEQNEPLPQTFSPHKRGQKFVPGGMAATVQQWIIETGQAAVQSRKGQGYLKGEDYVMRAKVESFVGDAPFMVRAVLPNGDAVRLVLAGNRSPNAAQSQELAHGCIVGIRAPTWEIELDDNMWTVGVDWKVLS